LRIDWRGTAASTDHSDRVSKLGNVVSCRLVVRLDGREITSEKVFSADCFVPSPSHSASGANAHEPISTKPPISTQALESKNLRSACK
jgi:hypothetical protein